MPLDAATGDFLVTDLGNATLFRVTASGGMTTIASGGRRALLATARGLETAATAYNQEAGPR